MGNNECKFNLAILYMKNNMEKEAVSLYKQLYKSGYEKGCYNLGLYMEINENYDEAERYYKKKR